jgi:4-diphosphocytidyl-2C-methyl-D-erythritol kinase
VLDSLRAAGAAAALVSGSGPTCFAVFDSPAAAIAVASGIDGALVTRLRSP